MNSKEMVFENRLNIGSSGYQIPPMPRFPRSARGKRSCPKKVEDNQMCSIDLLATVAGKILAEEGEITSPFPSKCPAEGITKPMQKVEDQMDLDVKPSGIISSDSSVKLLPCVDNRSARCRTFHSARYKDDDENSWGCTNRSTVYSKAFKPHCTVERRIRKRMASNYWKDEQAVRKDGDLYNDDEVKHDFRSRKLCYTRQRSQRNLFKRMKLFERCSISAASDPHISLNIAHGISCSTADQKSSLESPEHSVKLSIKSFIVPELFIEIPANATVGSLKRIVMEAVTAILSGGLRVGVLLQGKNVGDDNKTLLQAGIYQSGLLNDLDFTLEPSPARAPPPLEPKPLDKIKHSFHLVVSDIRSHFSESDQDSMHSTTDHSSYVHMIDPDCKALVPLLPPAKAEALAVVPIHKSRQSEMAQRRIRRPFSVGEVEALVQAVEKLGTGRWRDVKLRAFDNAKHRTYVDLKDKWKTLVHTANISPEQRRGEPVPQELLGRVLSVHAYWSQQQSKFQPKPTCPPKPCLHA